VRVEPPPFRAMNLSEGFRGHDVELTVVTLTMPGGSRGAHIEGGVGLSYAPSLRHKVRARENGISGRVGAGYERRCIAGCP
jgi:hypothetical protein